jgi:hypothetical protein
MIFCWTRAIERAVGNIADFIAAILGRLDGGFVGDRAEFGEPLMLFYLLK